MKAKIKPLLFCLLIILFILGYAMLYLPFASQFHYTQYTVKGNISGYEVVDDKLIVTVKTDTTLYRCQVELETVYDTQCHIIFDKRLTGIPIYVVLASYRPIDIHDHIYTAKNVGVLYDTDWYALVQKGIVTQEDIEQYSTTWR